MAIARVRAACRSAMAIAGGNVSAGGLMGCRRRHCSVLSPVSRRRAPRSPTTRAITSRSTSFFFRRAASRSAAVAMRSISRRLEPAASCSSVSASAVKTSRSAPARPIRSRTYSPVSSDHHRPDRQPPLDPRVERAVLAQLEPVLEVGEAHEDQRQQRAAIPFVIQEDVQVVERVLVKQVRLVEQEDRMDALSAEVLDVSADGVEDGGRRRSGGEAERLAELAIEVAPAERGVVAVGQSEAGLRQPMTHGPQHARLAGAGLADEQHLGALVDGLAHLLHDAPPWRAAARARCPGSPWRRAHPTA